MVNTGVKNSRVARLRSRMLRMPDICIQRAYWWTKSYQETEGEPEIIRRAKALAKVLEELPIHIDDDETIVGRTTSKERGGMLFPEIQWEYILKEIDLFSSRDWDRCGVVSDKEKEVLAETLPYWKSKCNRYRGWPVYCLADFHGGIT